MKYSSLNEAVTAFKKLQQTQSAYNHAMGVLYLDATTAAPSDTWEGRGKTMEILSEITYSLIANEENAKLYDFLKDRDQELDPQTLRELEVLRKSYDQLHRIPPQEYVAYSVFSTMLRMLGIKPRITMILMLLRRILSRSWNLIKSLRATMIRIRPPMMRC